MDLQPEKKPAKCKDGEQFWSANGHQFWTLYDLARGIQGMDDNAFAHHVNTHRNDFRAWVHDVIGDSTLAQGLVHLHDKESMMRRIVLRIRFLELMKDSTLTTARNSRQSPQEIPAKK